jgi:high-affinity iron transporter
MLASAVIVFREVLEAALIVGIILAATKGLDGSRRWVASGIAAGVLGSAGIAASAGALSEAMEGMGQEIFNASILALAVLMLAWHTVWMSRHGRETAAEMKRVGHAVSLGSRPLSILSVVVGIAVLREGAETVLFIFGVSASGDGGMMATLAGCAVGLGAGITVGILIYRGLLAIPARHLFTVTTWLVTLLAAGMAALAVTYLSAAGLIELSMQPLWDTSWLLPESSIGGRLLHTLVGYVDRPSAGQLAAYGVTLLGISGLARMVGRQST